MPVTNIRNKWVAGNLVFTDRSGNDIVTYNADSKALVFPETLQGVSTFASSSGRTVTHNLGKTNYIVNLIAVEATQGDLGDVHLIRAANAFTVYNTGGFTGSFRYQIMI